MNLNMSEAHKNEYNPLYYSGDSTKAALPSSVDITELLYHEQEVLGCIEKYIEAKHLH